MASTTWTELPAEIRMMLLEAIHESVDTSTPRTEVSPYEISVYAAVSLEWQEFFEMRNFANLILHQDDVNKLDVTLGASRRPFVERIWLRVELPEYTCAECFRAESVWESYDNNTVFTEAIHDLFHVLAGWSIKDRRPVGNESLHLELSAHSPSDAMHFCKELQSRMHDTAWNSRRIRADSKSDRFHGWDGKGSYRRPGAWARRRVFGDYRGLRYNDALLPASDRGPLPKIEAVRSLTIRRQFFRHISIINGLALIIPCLTALENFNYEPWRGVDTPILPGRLLRDRDHFDLFEDCLKDCKRLKRFTCYEDFNHNLYERPARKSMIQLGKPLAQVSQNWEDVHAAHNIDAKDFFHSFWPGIDTTLAHDSHWGKLKWLSLTSHAMSPFEYRTLIQAAGAAAKCMPKLEIMELWNGTILYGAVFRYKYNDQRPVVQLFSTWNSRLSANEISAWREVAAMRDARHDLTVDIGRLDRGVNADHVAMLPHLDLRTRLLTATSYDQIMMEMEARKEATSCRRGG